MLKTETSSDSQGYASSGSVDVLPDEMLLRIFLSCDALTRIELRMVSRRISRVVSDYTVFPHIPKMVRKIDSKSYDHEIEQVLSDYEDDNTRTWIQSKWSRLDVIGHDCKACSMFYRLMYWEGIQCPICDQYVCESCRSKMHSYKILQEEIL